MESKKGWAFVAQYNGKKVRKYVKTCEELNNYEWISESKFSFRDQNDTYCEGIVLAKEDDEQALRDVISTKNPRSPYSAFKLFPDPANVLQPMPQKRKLIEPVEKWKTRVARNAMNDFLNPIKHHKVLSNKEIPNNHAVEKTSVEITNPKERNESTLSSVHEIPEINHGGNFEETEQERERMGPTSTHCDKNAGKLINQIDEPITSSEILSDEDESNFNSENYMIISKKTYNRLLKKNNLLIAKLSGQENQRTKDLKIQKLAQRLTKAIKNRYNGEKGADELC